MGQTLIRTLPTALVGLASSPAWAQRAMEGRHMWSQGPGWEWGHMGIGWLLMFLLLGGVVVLGLLVFGLVIRLSRGAQRPTTGEESRPPR